MRQRMIIVLSSFITAVILIVVGGISTLVMAQKSGITPTPAAPAQVQATQDLAKIYQDREATYNQLIQEANQKLEKANTDLQAMQDQLKQMQSTATQPSPAANEAVSPDQATSIALQVVDGDKTLTKAVDLVDFQGKTAYELNFAKGLVYVNAQTGEVLFNGTVPQKITAEQAAKIASDYLQNTDILTQDTVMINKVVLFRIIFHSGTMAYVDSTGQIVDVTLPAEKVVGAPGGKSGGSSSSPTPGWHDDGPGDDH